MGCEGWLGMVIDCTYPRMVGTVVGPSPVHLLTPCVCMPLPLHNHAHTLSVPPPLPSCLTFASWPRGRTRRVSARTEADIANCLSVVGKLPFFQQLPQDRAAALTAVLEYSALPAGRIGE
jgi:hypothetical protein